MEQYIPKSALVAEIERIEYETNYEPFTDEVLGKRKVCKDIKDSIDTFEVKEVDLEKEAENFVQTGEFVKNENPVLAIAKYFFELGLRAQKGISYGSIR